MKHSRRVLLAILLLAALIRLYESHRFFYFDGDQSNDVAAVGQLAAALKAHAWGNLSAVGQEGKFYYHSEFPQFENQPNVVYNGAAYYYVLLPAAILSSFHPYGIVVFLILLSIGATLSLYIAGTLLIDRTTGILAALIHAVSFLILTYSRFIWTPSPVVSLSAIALASFVAILNGYVNYWVLLAVSVSLATQIHNSGYLLLGFILTAIIMFRPKLPKSKTVIFGAIFVFIFPLLPTLWNESNTDYLLPRAIIYQLSAHFADAYAGIPVWQIPLGLIKDGLQAFGQFTSLVLFHHGPWYGELRQDNKFLLSFQMGLWVAGVLAVLWYRARLDVSLSDKKKRFVILFCLSILMWAAIGTWLSKLYYQTDTAIFWLNGVSPFIPLTLFVFALLIRIFWQTSFLRVPLVMVLLSFAFFQGTATTNTFWQNTASDIMYGHQLQALKIITDDSKGQPYGLSVNSYSPFLPIDPILTLEHIQAPYVINRIRACTISSTLKEKLPNYSLIFYPNDGTATAFWISQHSGIKLFQGGNIAVYRSETK